MEGFEAQSRPRPGRDGTAERSVNRLLDSVVEQVIAETAHRRPPASPAPDTRDPVDAFLSDAAAFLRGRTDRPELIRRLRELVAEAAAAAPAAPPEPEPPEASPC
jgi:hypothetical protein